MFYGYLNLESTKTINSNKYANWVFYGYLNLESTKTERIAEIALSRVLRLLKS